MSLYWQGDVLLATPIITSGMAYTAGNCVGGLITITGNPAPYRVDGGKSILTDICVSDKSNQKKALQLLFYSAKPTATIADFATPAIATDIGLLLGKVAVAGADYTTFGSDNVGIAQEQITNGLLLVNTEGTRKLYVVVLTTDTPTFTSTTDLTFRFKLQQVL